MILLRRISAIAAFIAFLALLIGIATAGFFAADSFNAQRSAAVNQLMALHVRLRRLPSPSASAGKPEEADLTRLVLPSAAAGTATADLQSRLIGQAQSAGATIVSIRTLDDDPVGRLRRIGVGLSVEARTQSLRDLLEAIEASQPVAFIDGLSVRRQQTGTETSSRSRASDTDPTLAVSMEVSNYMLMGRPETRTGGKP